MVQATHADCDCLELLIVAVKSPCAWCAGVYKPLVPHSES